jgi:flagellar basal-body rod protein FlgF
MGTSIEATGSSIEALTNQYRIITHNLANSNTAGFKRQIGSIEQLVSGDSSVGAEVTEGISINFEQGPLAQTGRPMDFALEGANTFFVVETPDGPLYTRNGVFRANAEGQMVDAAGRMVSGDGGPLVIPPSVGTTGINVSKHGIVSGAGLTIGKIKVVKFEDATQLIPAGGVSFRAPEGVSPEAAPEAAVYQGFQESSNVVAVEELVDLITLSRLYEANIKTISAQDDSMKSIIQVAMS